MRMIFEFPAENAKIADWVAERGGFETPGSCRAYSKQLGPKRARYSRMKKNAQSLRSITAPLNVPIIHVGFFTTEQTDAVLEELRA